MSAIHRSSASSYDRFVVGSRYQFFNSCHGRKPNEFLFLALFCYLTRKISCFVRLSCSSICACPVTVYLFFRPSPSRLSPGRNTVFVPVEQIVQHLHRSLFGVSKESMDLYAVQVVHVRWRPPENKEPNKKPNRDHNPKQNKAKTAQKLSSYSVPTPSVQAFLQPVTPGQGGFGIWTPSPPAPVHHLTKCRGGRRR